MFTSTLVRLVTLWVVKTTFDGVANGFTFYESPRRKVSSCPVVRNTRTFSRTDDVTIASNSNIQKPFHPILILRQGSPRNEESADASSSVTASSSSPINISNAASTSASSSTDVNSSSSVGVVALSKLEDHDYETAVKRTLGWVAASAAFGTALFFFVSPQTSEEFFAGYLLEQSLSVDNLLVFLLLFEYFKIPTSHQNRVLNWGIIGAIVMRAIMIGAGAIAIQKFHAVLLGFAAILIYSSAKVLLGSDDDDDDEAADDLGTNTIVQFSSRLIKSTPHFDGDRFFTEVDGVRLATPMLLCMIAVEFSDVVFAVDSIPAVFGVTENPLVVFSSNMFAIMGLRSLFSILSKAASELKYLEPAVAIVLGFIGVKMFAEYFGTEVPTQLSLIVVATLLGGGVLASILDEEKTDDETNTSS